MQIKGGWLRHYLGPLACFGWQKTFFKTALTWLILLITLIQLSGEFKKHYFKVLQNRRSEIRSRFELHVFQRKQRINSWDKHAISVVLFWLLNYCLCQKTCSVLPTDFQKSSVRYTAHLCVLTQEGPSETRCLKVLRRMPSTMISSSSRNTARSSLQQYPLLCATGPPGFCRTSVVSVFFWVNNDITR